MEPDIALTFDPDSFKTGIKSMMDSLAIFEKAFEKTENSVQESSNKSGKKMTDSQKSSQTKANESAKNETNGFGAWAMAKGTLIAGAITSAMSKISSNIPEIANTASIASDIFLRNFLWPLRKEMIPMLQSFLNWTRDHRAMFVQWGTYLANVFRAVVSVFRGMSETIQNLWNYLIGGIEKRFGKMTKTTSEVFNLILFKITAIFLFAQMLLEPIVEFIIDSVINIVYWVNQFYEGFAEAFGGAMPFISDIGDSLSRLFDVFNFGSVDVEYIGQLFRVLGSIAGTELIPVFAALAQIIDTIVSALRDVVFVGRIAAATLSGDFEKAGQLMDERRKSSEEYKERTSERWNKTKEGVVAGVSSVEKNWNAVGSPKGQVIAGSQTVNNSQTNHSNIVLNVELPKDQPLDPQNYANIISKGVNDALREEERRRGQR